MGSFGSKEAKDAELDAEGRYMPDAMGGTANGCVLHLDDEAADGSSASILSICGGSLSPSPIISSAFAKLMPTLAIDTCRNEKEIKSVQRNGMDTLRAQDKVFVCRRSL